MVKTLTFGRSPAQRIPAVVGMVFLAGVALLAATPAHAGRSCESRKPVPPQVIERGMKLAEQTSVALDAEHAKSGVQVVALARAGQDLSKYGLRYSHFGWAYKTAEGPWHVAHKLNECGTAVGHLYRQGLGEFFLDDLWRYEAVYAVPTPEVQQRLLAVLQDKGRTKALQHPPYSMVSYGVGPQIPAVQPVGAGDPGDGHGARHRALARPGAGLAAVQGLRAHHAQAGPAHAHGRAGGLGQHCV